MGAGDCVLAVKLFLWSGWCYTPLRYIESRLANVLSCIITRGCFVSTEGALPTNTIRQKVSFGSKGVSLTAFKIVHCFSPFRHFDVCTFLPKGSEFGGDGYTDYQDSVVSDRQKVRGVEHRTPREKERRHVSCLSFLSLNTRDVLSRCKIYLKDLNVYLPSYDTIL